MRLRQEAEAAVQRFGNRNRVDSEFTAILVIYHEFSARGLIRIRGAGGWRLAADSEVLGLDGSAFISCFASPSVHCRCNITDFVAHYDPHQSSTSGGSRNSGLTVIYVPLAANHLSTNRITKPYFQKGKRQNVLKHIVSRGPDVKQLYIQHRVPPNSDSLN